MYDPDRCREREKGSLGQAGKTREQPYLVARQDVV